MNYGFSILSPNPSKTKGRLVSKVKGRLVSKVPFVGEGSKANED